MYIETKQVYNIRKIKGNSPSSSLLTFRTRNQHELVRSNASALIKFGVFFLIQLPPIVGYVIVIIAMRSPKYLLTPHFWTPEQLTKFRVEEHIQRQASSVQLSTSGLLDRGSMVAHLVGLLEGTTPLSATQPSDLLVHLASAHATCHYEGLMIPKHYSLLPQVLLLNMLRRSAVEIMTDDLFFIASDPAIGSCGALASSGEVCVEPGLEPATSTPSEDEDYTTLTLPGYQHQFRPRDTDILRSTHIMSNVRLLSPDALRLAVIRRGIGTLPPNSLDISTSNLEDLRRMLVCWLLVASRSVGITATATATATDGTTDPLLRLKGNHELIASYMCNIALGLQCECG